MARPMIVLSPDASYDNKTTIAVSKFGGVLAIPGNNQTAWQLAEATTNLAVNPAPNAAWYRTPNQTGVVMTDVRSPSGKAMEVTFGQAGPVNIGNTTTTNISEQGTYTQSIYIWCDDGSVTECYIDAFIRYTDNTTGTRPGANWVAIGPEPKRFTMTTTTDPAKTPQRAEIYVYSKYSAIGAKYRVGAHQVEKKPYATPYADGSLGAGHAWSGTANASTSTRTNAYIQVERAGRINVDRGEILMRFNVPDTTNTTPAIIFRTGAAAVGSNSIMLHRVGSTFYLRSWGTTTLATITKTVDLTRHRAVAISWTPESITMQFDGETIQTEVRPAYTGDFSWSYFRFGDATQTWNGNLEIMAAFADRLADDDRTDLLDLDSTWDWTSFLATTTPVIFVTGQDPAATSSLAGVNAVFATRTRLLKANRYGDVIEVVEDDRPITGSVTFNIASDITRHLTIDLIDPAKFKPFVDWIIPEVTLVDTRGMEQKVYLGHFSLVKPTSIMRPGHTIGSFEADDVTILLKHARLVSGFTVKAGTDWGEAADSLARQYGMRDSQIALPKTGVTAIEDKTFPPGAEVYATMNECYRRAGWNKVVANGRGVLISSRWKSLEKPAIKTTYRNYGPNVLLIPPVEELEPDWSMLYNQVTVRNINPDKPAIYHTSRVSNASSPVHPNNIGRIIAAEPIDDSEIETNAQAKQKADELLLQASSYLRRVRITSVIDMKAGAYDVVALDIMEGTQRYTGKWFRDEWTINLSDGTATIEQVLRRAEEWGDELSDWGVYQQGLSEAEQGWEVPIDDDED